ncbi:MAG: hypothetical protein AB7F50_07040 [Fimbriimonadaceae bacterium]
MESRWTPAAAVLVLLATAAQSQAPTVALDKAKEAYSAAMSAQPSKTVCEACVWWNKVESTLDLANGYMYSPDLLPKDKYPSALKHYRATLKLYPTLIEAKQGADTIVSIYQGMGREVPE